MKIRRKYLFYALAFTSSIIAASVAAIDSTIISLYIPNAWAFGFSCFLVGSLISLIIVLVFSIPIKGKSLGSRIIDPSFKRLRLVRKQELKYHLFPLAIIFFIIRKRRSHDRLSLITLYTWRSIYSTSLLPNCYFVPNSY